MNKITLQERDLYKIMATDSLLTNIPGHIYWKNKDSVFLGCNIEHARYFGFDDPNKIVGKNNFDLVDYDSAVKLTENDMEVISKATVIETVEVLYGNQYFLSKKMPLRDFKGEVVGILGISLNITKQKLAELSLAQRAKELVEALELKERFIRNINHEIRTPLVGMINIPESLRDNYYNLSDEQRLHFIDETLLAGERLRILVNNLLDLSKFKDGKFTMEFAEYNIKEIIEETIREFKHIYGNINFLIEQDVSTNIKCDKERIKQVIRNLIGNSIKYGGQNKPMFIYVFNYEEDSDQKFIKITIKDEGYGIPKGEEESIFQAFVESSQTRKLAGGTGLGLTIAKEIVESHKGKIWVEVSEPNQVGTCISFTLPVSL